MDASQGRCQVNRLLKEIDMTQAELARRTGINKRAISYFCNDERPMYYYQARLIAKVIGCKLDDIYED